MKLKRDINSGNNLYFEKLPAFVLSGYEKVFNTRIKISRIATNLLLHIPRARSQVLSQFKRLFRVSLNQNFPAVTSESSRSLISFYMISAKFIWNLRKIVSKCALLWTYIDAWLWLFIKASLKGQGACQFVKKFTHTRGLWASQLCFIISIPS